MNIDRAKGTQLEEAFRELALEAGEAILRVRSSAALGAKWKGDGTIVTAADLAADRIIRLGLERRCPDIAVVSEEDSGSHQVESDRFILVDPLDGTGPFSRGSDEFTVNIALIEQGKPRLGVVYAPATDLLYQNLWSGGVLEWQQAGTAKRYEREIFGPGEEAAKPRIVTSNTSRHAPAFEEFRRRTGAGRTMYVSSSIKFCMVAAGDFDYYPRFGPTMEWDTAAGHAVLAATGGHVSRYADATPLVYGKPGLLNPSFLVSGTKARLRDFRRTV